VNDFERRINELSEEFDRKCFEKHQLGEEKYGTGTWLGVDTMEHLKDEVIDASNYARMTYIKLCLAQEGLARIQTEGQTAAPLTGKEMIGKESIMNLKGMPQQ